MSATMGSFPKDPLMQGAAELKYWVSKRNAARKKGGKLSTSQAGAVAASTAAVGQFLSISREAFILRTR